METIRRDTGRIARFAGAALGDRTMDAILSTTDVALDNHRVLGWETPLPASVPLIDTHRDADDGVSSVIGRCVPRFEGSRLCGRLSFAAPEVNERAEIAYKLCLNGYVDSVSVSFIPLEWKYPADRSIGMDITEARLLETSVVAVGSDARAKIFARAVRAHVAGRETREDRRVLAQAIRRRIRREDAARRGYETEDDRAARARAHRARILRETPP
jgi:hypothetical protein